MDGFEKDDNDQSDVVIGDDEYLVDDNDRSIESCIESGFKTRQVPH
jgi:hypothetical protein